MVSEKRLLCYCPTSIGGIARNAHEQAKAFLDNGIDVALLCPEDWPYPSSDEGYRQIKTLTPPPNIKGRGTFKNRVLVSFGILKNVLKLNAIIQHQQYSRVLLSSYSEYLSPLWSWLLKKRQSEGVIFGVMVLDPVRDYVIGPIWWHQWSIAEAYSFVREAFVHKKIDLDTVKPMPLLRTSVVPHGPYLYPEPQKQRKVVRSVLQIPEDAKVFMSFGHLRDNKNLDLVLQALAKHPNAYLLVAGTEASSKQKTSSTYRSIAESLGVSSRVRWLIRYIHDDEVPELFNAVDYVLMTYSVSFRSTSGILYIAAPLKIPILVSCGDAPLGTLVEKYQLGYRVEPDSAESISEGMKYLISNSHLGRWSDFLSEHTYRDNAKIIANRLME